MKILKQINLLFLFNTLILANCFSMETKKEVKPEKLTEKVKNEREVKKELKYKVAIFSVSRIFWKFGLYDILKEYSSFSDIFKIIKYGTEYLVGDFNPAEAFEDFLSKVKGKSKEEIVNKCHEIWNNKCKSKIYNDSIEHLKKLKEEGVILVIAEAGMKELYTDLLDFLFKKYNLKFDYEFFSEFEYKDNKATGKLIDRPCIGEHKFQKLEKFLREKNISLDKVIFYASSHLDILFLERVGKRIIINPTSKLEHYAKTKNWEILEFKDFVI